MVGQDTTPAERLEAPGTGTFVPTTANEPVAGDGRPARPLPSRGASALLASAGSSHSSCWPRGC